MSIVRELFDDAIALQKDGLSPSRIGLALTDRWEAVATRKNGPRHTASMKLRPLNGAGYGAWPNGAPIG